MDTFQSLSREQSRAVDTLAIERYGFSGMVLMENAGRGVVEVLVEIDPSLVGGKDSRSAVGIFCGKGNNGGDGFVIARHLEILGAPVRVFLLAPASELTGDAERNFKILTHTQVPIVDLSGSTDTALSLNEHAADTSWLIDAMLGTGAVGEPREPYRTAIEWLNRNPGRRLAVDVPSGLDCDTGRPSACTVRADITCTFVAPKVGFAKGEAAEFVGQLHVVSIGVPRHLIAEAARVS